MTQILDFHPSCTSRPMDMSPKDVAKIQNPGHFYKNLQNHSFMQYRLNAEIRFVFAILFISVQGADGVELRHPRGEHYLNLG